MSVTTFKIEKKMLEFHNLKDFGAKLTRNSVEIDEILIIY